MGHKGAVNIGVMTHSFTYRFVVVLAVLAGLLTFLLGFLPLKTSVPGYSVPTLTESQPAPISRLVIMVVDALRTDFVSEHQSSNWPYLHGLVKAEYTKSYSATVHPPTLTLPSIKAMISGDIPGFVDVIMNCASEELAADNLLHQLNATGKKSVLYGDDTWLRLFPNSFIRSEGVSSFFLPEYTEVDHEVTRHLDKELARNDWDVMVLHYSGLDHIGHLIGPFSDLVPEKLREMDKVLQKIHSQLAKQDDDYLILLTGDHGMADKGGHGGVTPNEVNIPLVFISNHKLSEQQSPASSNHIYQIDVVPTLSALCGVSTPQNSRGVVISDLLLSLLGVGKTLQSAVDNSKQLVVLLKKGQSKQSEKLLERHGRLMNQYSVHRNSSAWLDETRASKLLSSFIELNADMRQMLASKMVEYDVTAMITGLAVMVTAFFSALCRSTWTDVDTIHIYSSLLVAGVTISSYSVVCTSNTCYSSVLCYTALGSTVLLVEIILLTTVVCSLFQRTWTVYTLVPRFSLIDGILLTLSVLHSVSMLSSSFIEEEHQVAYFFSITLVTGCLLHCLTSQSPKSRNSVYLSVVMVLMSICHKWNQTGDKWPHRTDVSDVLNRPDWFHWKAAGSLLSLVGIHLTVSSSKPVSVIYSLSSFVSSICMGLYVAEDLGLFSFSDRGLFEGRLLYFTVGVVFLYSVYLGCSGSHTSALVTLRLSWIILVTFLHKTVNLPVMLAIVLMEHLLSLSLVEHSSETVALIYYWMGSASYFYQGNSYSLSSMDVSAGYKGLVSSNLVLTGVLTFCNVFSAPIFWIISCLVLLSKRQHDSRTRVMKSGELSSLYLCLKLAGLLTLLFLIVIERYHLFVWTVFAPKLIYETFAINIFLLLYLTCYR